MRSTWRATPLLLLLSLLSAPPALAGGLYSYEVGSPDMGTAAAGYAARAQDASTAWTNPAGMARLEKREILLGLQPMYVKADFTPNASTSPTLGGPGGSGGGFLPAGSAFLVQPLSKDFRLGLAMVGNFGLAVKYEDDWVGRYFVREAKMQGITLMPTVSWRVTPTISVGAGATAMYGIFKEKVAVNNRPFGVTPDIQDGQLELEDHDWGFGGKFGILWEPTKAVRLGATYTTQTKISFNPAANFSGLGSGLETILESRGLLGAKIGMDLTLPQAVMASAFVDVTDRLALTANMGWEEWSRFGKVGITVVDNTTTSLDVERHYKDTWHVALGAQYRVAKTWLLTSGVAYDSSMVDDKDRTPDLPAGENWRFALGTLWSFSPDVTLGGAYELIWNGDLPMDVSRASLAGTRVAGSYNSSAIHVGSFNLAWKF